MTGEKRPRPASDGGLLRSEFTRICFHRHRGPIAPVEYDEATEKGKATPQTMPGGSAPTMSAGPRGMLAKPGPSPLLRW